MQTYDVILKPSHWESIREGNRSTMFLPLSGYDELSLGDHLLLNWHPELFDTGEGLLVVVTEMIWGLQDLPDRPHGTGTQNAVVPGWVLVVVVPVSYEREPECLV